MNHGSFSGQVMVLTCIDINQTGTLLLQVKVFLKVSLLEQLVCKLCVGTDTNPNQDAYFS